MRATPLLGWMIALLAAVGCGPVSRPEAATAIRSQTEQERRDGPPSALAVPADVKTR